MPLEKTFRALTGFPPLSWQKRLFDQYLISGKIPSAVDIPTGLGKTAVMALWLIARAKNSVLPRRLVYVVDRRVVVDQATFFAVELRKNLDGPAKKLKNTLGLAGRSLLISTLRGQHIDNREWLDDPSIPAIVVGTVDMIGSRLLFEGYGVSRKMRPYHAGLLGVDTLVVLDEAHLVPPFEKLLENIESSPIHFAGRSDNDKKLIPPFRLLSLSATGRERSGSIFHLEDADLQEPHLDEPITRKRLTAKKAVTISTADEKKLAIQLAKEAWELSGNSQQPTRCIVYCDKRETAENTQSELYKLANGGKKKGKGHREIAVGLFVGARRIFERENAARELQETGFIAGSQAPRTKPAFLVATSAGEVGVDLDADHMVCDLVAWERMVQRFGRVNRRGERDADVRVLAVPPKAPKMSKPVAPVTPEPAEPTKPEKPGGKMGDAAKQDYKLANKDYADKLKEYRNNKKKYGKKQEEYQAEIEKYKEAMEPTRIYEARKDAIDRLDGDASPAALRKIALQAENDNALQTLLADATTPAPLRPAFTRALVDAWSMTSLKEHTGRPEVAPWLRGWVEDKPQTAVVWRTYLPIRAHNSPPVQEREIESFFEAARPHATEMLETETWRVADWLMRRTEALAGKRHQTGNDSDLEQVREHEVAGSSAPQNDEIVVFALNQAGDLRQKWNLKDLIELKERFDAAQSNVKKYIKDDLHKNLAGLTLVVDARLGGINEHGMLDENEAGTPRTTDDSSEWLPSNGEVPIVRFRVHSMASEITAEDKKQWRERLRFSAEQTSEGEVTRWLVVEKWRYDAAIEEDRSVGPNQTLKEHQDWAARKARELAARLGLPVLYATMLAVAARLHDEGKRAERWQRAFNAPRDAIYAKTAGPLNPGLLDGYRHEFGSLPIAENDPEFNSLPEELQELALHLIAAHHGQARPIIRTNSCADAPPSALETRARVVALRFARLQKRWGPWGLAWWEALLRAADQQASRDNETRNIDTQKETH